MYPAGGIASPTGIPKALENSDQVVRVCPSLEGDILSQKELQKVLTALSYTGGECIGFIILRQLDIHHGIKQMNSCIILYFSHSQAHREPGFLEGRKRI